jgi:hypothetical protein
MNLLETLARHSSPLALFQEKPMKRLAQALTLPVLLAFASCSNSETATRIDLSGVMSAVGSADVTAVSFTLYGARDLVVGAGTARGSGQVGAGGAWSVSGVDVSQVDDALVAVTDGSDRFFPTLSGVVEYSGGTAKENLDSGHLFAVKRSVANAFAAAMGRPELTEQGFVMGAVTDGRTPVAGATVKSASNLTLEVWYPTADLTGLSRTETSANGLFVIPADPALLFLDLAAEKKGHAFSTALAPLKAGTCSFAVILPAPGSSAPRILLDVGGGVVAIGASAAGGVSVEALAPYDYATSISPIPLASATTTGAGAFSWTGVDVANVSQGLLARVEDASGAFFPTVSGVTAWASEADADKKLQGSARVFAVSNRIAQALAAALGEPEMLAAGFTMGMVTDGAAPVAGATVARTHGKALTVVYPSADFTSLSGSTTSANGLFVLLPDASLEFASITAAKEGRSFGSTTLLPKPGVCYFAVVR